MSEQDGPVSVYELYDADGAPVYVGVAKDVDQRLRWHAEHQPWWSEVDEARVIVSTHATAWDAAQYERGRILALVPRGNRVGVTAPHSLYPSTRPADHTEGPSLLALRELQAQFERIPIERAELIAAAREAGHSWVEIGRALGMSHVGAMKASKPSEARAGRPRKATD